MSDSPEARRILGAGGRLRALLRHRAVRYATLVPTIAIAIIAAAIVASVTIDLGPSVHALAEREGSKRIDRPLHIGRLSIRLLTGRIELEDVRIDGKHPGDRPFLTARLMSVSLDWSEVLKRRPEFIITSFEMTDWRMLVEKWKDGSHNFIRVSSNSTEPRGPSRFTTTMKYLRARGGEFIYEDHGTPWTVNCPNIDINIGNLPKYHGQLSTTGGVVKIQNYEPMSSDMTASFSIDGGKILLDRIELTTDGAQSVLTGEVDTRSFPEMTYQVKSRVDFPRMRDIFWHNETWDLSGEGDFTGVFHLFRGGHDLTGTFTSRELGINDYRFPSLYGALRWTNEGFDVWDAGGKAFGGDATLTYSLKPFGAPVKPTHRFDVNYTGVDVAALTDFYELPGVRFAGLASGHNLLEWPSGGFAEKRDEGRVTIVPPAGVQTMTPALGRPRAADAAHAREWGPFAPMPLPAHVPIAGELTYRFDPTTVYLENGIFATEDTHVSFAGTTEWGDRSNIPFHVTSRDWQESDQILAGIITDFGSPTGVVAFNGRGEFDGVMTGAFRRPRVEGLFSGEDLRAWDTVWGDGTARLVIEDNYVTIRDSVVRLDGAEIRTDGKFSLGYPRRDRGEEINARFRVARRDLDSLRHAFELEEYPVSGALSGEFHLTGQYEHPIGFGRMTIENGLAYGESFQRADASLRFDGAGVRLDGLTIVNADGAITGAAFVGWDSTYSFNASGRRIPVETIAMLRYPSVPMSGLADFQASGSGTFDVPRYDVKFLVNDLFVAEEGVGHVTGALALRGKELSGNIDAASPRLALTGTGRISLTPKGHSELTFRFHDSSFDPYVRLFVPKLSPYTTAVATGSIRVAGDLADIDRLLIEATVDALDMRLFDYALKNAAPIRLSMDQHQVKVQQLQVVGEDTKLSVSGSVGLHDEQIALQVEGDANLGILQGFFRNVRGSGYARLSASVNGPLREPLFSGSATITDGRVRHLSLPNALDAINGVLYFDPRGVRLDELTATMGGGKLQFGGRIGFVGYAPGDLNVTVRGENVRLRYPEGVRSQIDGDLALRGSFAAPTLGGSVTVRNAVWSRRIDPTAGLFDFGGAGAAGPGVPAVADTVPLRFDIRVLAPSSLHIDNNLVENMVASADLQLRGTYDRPVVFGRAEVDRGIVRFEGRRYTISRGTIDFTNPARIEPFFDVEAETMVRVPGQTYRVIVSAAGTADRLQPQLSSDPPLPEGDVLTLLFSDVRRGSEETGIGDVELRARQNPNERQTDILTTRATQLLATPLSSEVGRVVEQAFGVDTFQLSPSLVDPYSQTTTLRVNPSARVTIGKRISDRIFMTFSRSISTDRNDQLILLEYNESDQLSWILSRNEDSTYAIEFRVRHTF